MDRLKYKSRPLLQCLYYLGKAEHVRTLFIFLMSGCNFSKINWSIFWRTFIIPQKFLPFISVYAHLYAFARATIFTVPVLNYWQSEVRETLQTFPQGLISFCLFALRTVGYYLRPQANHTGPMIVWKLAQKEWKWRLILYCELFMRCPSDLEAIRTHFHLITNNKTDWSYCFPYQ